MAQNLENVERFFALYDADPSLRERLRQAEAMYPGSLELRDAVVEAVLLPAAAELGLPFTVKELQAYETRRLLRFSRDAEDTSEEVPAEQEYWLLAHGWEENPIETE